MSVAAENGRDETLGVGLFGGGSVGDHAPTEPTAEPRHELRVPRNPRAKVDDHVHQTLGVDAVHDRLAPERVAALHLAVRQHALALVAGA